MTLTYQDSANSAADEVGEDDESGADCDDPKVARREEPALTRGFLAGRSHERRIHGGHQPRHRSQRAYGFVLYLGAPPRCSDVQPWRYPPLSTWERFRSSNSHARRAVTRPLCEIVVMNLAGELSVHRSPHRPNPDAGVQEASDIPFHQPPPPHRHSYDSRVPRGNVPNSKRTAIEAGRKHDAVRCDHDEARCRKRRITPDAWAARSWAVTPHLPTRFEPRTHRQRSATAAPDGSQPCRCRSSETSRSTDRASRRRDGDRPPV